MKKWFIAATLLVCALFCFAQSGNSFVLPAGERWQGRVNYTESGGARHSVFYEIIFVSNGSCIITVQTKEKGKDLFQDSDGLWSFDENFLRIEGEFANPQIEGLPDFRWVSVYQFDAPGNRFTLLIPPYPGAKTNVRVQFIRTGE